MKTTLAILLALVCFVVSQEMIGEFDDKFYWTYDEDVTMEEAKTRCAATGWTLLTLDTEAEHDYVSEMVNQYPATAFWTSAQSTDTWKWTVEDGEGNVLDPTLYPVDPMFRTCIVYWGPSLFAHPCDRLEGLSYRPLCQMRNAKAEN